MIPSRANMMLFHSRVVDKPISLGFYLQTSLVFFFFKLFSIFELPFCFCSLFLSYLFRLSCNWTLLQRYRLSQDLFYRITSLFFLFLLKRKCPHLHLCPTRRCPIAPFAVATKAHLNLLHSRIASCRKHAKSIQENANFSSMTSMKQSQILDSGSGMNINLHFPGKPVRLTLSIALL